MICCVPCRIFYCPSIKSRLWFTGISGQFSRQPSRHCRAGSGETVAAFSPAKAILLKDALPYLAASAEINVFELMDLITAKQGGKAMDLLSEMLRRGEDPVRLLALVRYQLRQIVRVKEWQRQKIDENQMAEALGVRPFAIKRISSGASKFRREDLYQL